MRVFGLNYHEMLSQFALMQALTCVDVSTHLGSSLRMDLNIWQLLLGRSLSSNYIGISYRWHCSVVSWFRLSLGFSLSFGLNLSLSLRDRSSWLFGGTSLNFFFSLSVSLRSCGWS